MTSSRSTATRPPCVFWFVSAACRGQRTTTGFTTSGKTPAAASHTANPTSRSIGIWSRARCREGGCRQAEGAGLAEALGRHEPSPGGWLETPSHGRLTVRHGIIRDMGETVVNLQARRMYSFPRIDYV